MQFINISNNLGRLSVQKQTNDVRAELHDHGETMGMTVARKLNHEKLEHL
jgi:hypothetical protein